MLGILADWADRSGIDLVAPEPEDAVTELDSPRNCRLIVLSVGAQSIRERENQQRIRVLLALAPEVPIVVLSDREEPDEVIGALVAGVRGFLPSNMSRDLAIQAISFIINGGSFFPPAALRRLRPGESEASGGGRPRPIERPLTDLPHRLDDNGSDDDSRGAAMTSRQLEVLRLLKDGQPNKVIARNLGMTEATVKVHVRQIMRKLGASNRTQAALCAVHADESVLHAEADHEVGDEAEDLGAGDALPASANGRRRATHVATVWAAE